MKADKGKVLVTGATGYIGSHVINELLKRGYSVIGTVRSLANKQKNEFLFTLPNAKQHLELRQADLLNPASWDQALKGVENVLHVASPIPPYVPQNQDDLIKPAVEGTRNIINSSLKNKIKRLLFTSSGLTVVVRTDGKIGNQDDWSDEKLLRHYPKSKFLAEKLFWSQAEKHKGQMQFISILPTLVTGPAFSKHANSSEAFVSDILNGGYPGIPTPSTQFSAVDVRDVAVGHVNALQYPEAAGKRYIISGYKILTEQIFTILRNKYEQQGYKIPNNLIDAEGIKKSGHGPSLRTVAFLGRKFQIDNSRGIKELGMKYKNGEESIIDQAQRQIELGIVHKLQ